MDDHFVSSIWSRIEHSWSTVEVDTNYIDYLQKALSSPDEKNGSSKGVLSRWVLLPSLCCQAAGGDPVWTINIAAAWLLFYFAADLMDSVEDQDEPDWWWANLGPAAALNAASGMFFCATRLLNDLYNQKRLKSYANDLIDDFSSSFLRMCSGQHLDIVSDTISLNDYWKIADIKSGTFFALACQSGAKLATKDIDRTRFFGQFGKHLGILVQILDDLDDLKSIQKSLSPRQSKSLLHSLSIVYSLEVAPSNERNLLMEYVKSAPDFPEVAQKALALIEKFGANLFILTELERHKQLALSYLEKAKPLSPAAEILSEYIQKLANPR